MQHMPIQITAVPKAFAPNGEITFCLKKNKTYHTYEEIIIVNMLRYHTTLHLQDTVPSCMSTSPLHNQCNPPRNEQHIAFHSGLDTAMSKRCSAE